MSAYRTLNITRGQAKRELISHLFDSADDALLSSMLEEIRPNSLLNYRIVNDDDESNDDMEL